MAGPTSRGSARLLDLRGSHDVPRPDFVETWKEAEAYVLTLALGMVGAGFLILIYAYGPVATYLRSRETPVDVSVSDLAGVERAYAAGSWVTLGPVDIDYSRARVRAFGEADGSSSYSAYVAIPNSEGRTVAVARASGFRSAEQVPSARLPGVEVSGVLLRDAPVLLAKLDGWPRNRLPGWELSDLWILLVDEKPPTPEEFLPLTMLGLVLFLGPLVVVGGYFRYVPKRLIC